VKGRLGKRVGVPHDAAADQLRSRLSTTAARIAAAVGSAKNVPVTSGTTVSR